MSKPYTAVSQWEDIYHEVESDWPHIVSVYFILLLGKQIYKDYNTIYYIGSVHVIMHETNGIQIMTAFVITVKNLVQ